MNKCLEDSFVIRLLRYIVKNVLKEGWSVVEKKCYTEFIILIDKKVLFRILNKFLEKCSKIDGFFKKIYWEKVSFIVISDVFDNKFYTCK